MVITVADTDQAALEVKAARLLDTARDERKTVTEIFGGMQDWELEIGSFRFLLLPYNREWWFWDTIHKDWRYTGYHAGEVIFALIGENIEFHTPEKTPAGAQGSQAPAQKRFCPQCGASLKPGLKFCSSCGVKIG